MSPRALARFAVEAAFIVLVAVGARAAHLRPLAILAAMAAAYVVALAAQQVARRAVSRPQIRKVGEQKTLPAASGSGFGREVTPDRSRRDGRPAKRRAATGAGRTEAEERPKRVNAREEAPGAASSSPLPAGRLCLTCGARISQKRLRALPNATQCIDCKRGRPPTPVQASPERRSQRTRRKRVAPSESAGPQKFRPQPRPQPEANPVAWTEPISVHATDESLPEVLPLSSPGIRTWNVRELERLARAADPTARNEEWEFLLVSLRDFADADGALPADFDAFVRESFPELVETIESA